MLAVHRHGATTHEHAHARSHTRQVTKLLRQVTKLLWRGGPASAVEMSGSNGGTITLMPYGDGGGL
jgi:hypothetical protein